MHKTADILQKKKKIELKNRFTFLVNPKIILFQEMLWNKTKQQILKIICLIRTYIEVQKILCVRHCGQLLENIYKKETKKQKYLPINESSEHENVEENPSA